MKTLSAIMAFALAVVVTLVAPAEANAPVVNKQINIRDLAYEDPYGYALEVTAQKGWSAKQFDCLVQLWEKESHWNYKADNPNSSAYGIAQMLNEKSKHPATQIDNGINYIEYRYENACNAWQFWKRNFYY